MLVFRAGLVWCQAIISKIARWFRVRTRVHRLGMQEHKGIVVECNSISFGVNVRSFLVRCVAGGVRAQRTQAQPVYTYMYSQRYPYPRAIGHYMRFSPFYFHLNMIFSVFSILYFLYPLHPCFLVLRGLHSLGVYTFSSISVNTFLQSNHLTRNVFLD